MGPSIGHWEGGLWAIIGGLLGPHFPAVQNSTEHRHTGQALSLVWITKEFPNNSTDLALHTMLHFTYIYWSVVSFEVKRKTTNDLYM